MFVKRQAETRRGKVREASGRRSVAGRVIRGVGRVSWRELGAESVGISSGAVDSHRQTRANTLAGVTLRCHCGGTRIVLGKEFKKHAVSEF